MDEVVRPSPLDRALRPLHAWVWRDPHRRARKLLRFLTQPFAVTEAFTGATGQSVALRDTLAGCQAILDGEADEWPESDLYMVGNFEQARQRARAT